MIDCSGFDQSDRSFSRIVWPLTATSLRANELKMCTAEFFLRKTRLCSISAFKTIPVDGLAMIVQGITKYGIDLTYQGYYVLYGEAFITPTFLIWSSNCSRSSFEKTGTPGCVFTWAGVFVTAGDFVSDMGRRLGCETSGSLSLFSRSFLVSSMRAFTVLFLARTLQEIVQFEAYCYLTHCCLMKPWGVIELGQCWFK